MEAARPVPPPEGDDPRFAEEAPQGAEEATDAGAGDSGVELLEAAPGSEHQQEQAAYTGTWREAALPERRVARTPARAPESLPDHGVATCPACAARNPFDARACGRCAAEIPPPSASAPLVVVTPGAGIALRVVPRASQEPLPDDPLEVLPPAVREQILATRATKAARSAAALEREAARLRAIAGASAALAVVAGWVVSLVLIEGWGGRLGSALVDAAAGGGAGWWVWSRGGGAHRGLLAYGAAAFVSAGCKLAIGGTPAGSSALAAFVVLLPVTWGAAALGGLIGQRIDDWLWDQS